MNEPDVFDSKLLQRLTRPLVQPGVIKAGMARGIILRSQRFANRLPLLAIAQRHYNVAESQTEQLPIVYAQSRLPETAISSGISIQADRQVSQSDTSQTTVVQAKFASPTSQTSAAINPQVVTQSENTTNSLPLVNSLPLINSAPDNNEKNLTPQPPSLKGKGEQDFLLPSPFRGGAGGGVNYDSSQDNLEAKSVPIVYTKPLPLPNNSIPNRDRDNYESLQIPIIYGKSQTNDGVNKLNDTVSTAKSIPAVGETISPPLPKLIVQQTRTNSTKVNTPLVFSNPSVTTPQASPEVQNIGIEKFSNTPTNPTIAAVTPQLSASPNLPSQVTHSQEALPQIDIDTLAAKVERKLMRKLVIENERRGRKL